MVEYALKCPLKTLLISVVFAGSTRLFFKIFLCHFGALYFEQYVSVSICITVMQPYLITGLINWTKKWAAPGGHGPLTPLSTY